MTRPFLSLLTSPLAMSETELQAWLAEDLRPDGKHRSDAAEQSAAERNTDYLPTVDELIVADGVAVLPLHGLMIKRSRVIHTWMESRALVGSDHRAWLVDQIRQRDDIHTLIVDADTGGGQVSGTQRLADAVYRARHEMAVIGVVNETAASAGLWVLSQCGRIVCPESGQVGSLGVYMVHLDDTKFFAEVGFDKTVIHRGKYKAIHERTLDDDGQAELQRSIDATYSLFIDAVARGRGMSPADVIERWGESGMIGGGAALSSGLTDELGTLQDVLDSIKAGQRGRAFVPRPATEQPPTGVPDAMTIKLSKSGQLVDDKGAVIGTVSDLALGTEDLRRFCSDAVDAIVVEAVDKKASELDDAVAAAATKTTEDANARLTALSEAVGAERAIAAFLAGDTVDKAKAGMADDLAAQLKERDDELAKLRKNGSTAGGRGPVFKASDETPPSKSDTNNADDPNAAYLEDWKANADGAADKFPSLEAYSAYRRYQDAVGS